MADIPVVVYGKEGRRIIGTGHIKVTDDGYEYICNITDEEIMNVIKGDDLSYMPIEKPIPTVKLDPGYIFNNEKSVIHNVFDKEKRD